MHFRWADIEFLGEASCEILGIVEADVVCNFRNVHILTGTVAYHLLCDVKAVSPDELRDGLSENSLNFFVQHTSAHTHRLRKGVDVEIRILIHFLDCFK